MKNKTKLHYSWVICALGALVLFTTHGYANSVLPVFLPLLEELGYSGTQSSALVTVRTAFTVLGMFFMNRLYTRISLKTGLTLCCGMVCAAFVLMGLENTYSLYVLGAMLIGLAAGFGTTAPVSLFINKWFASLRTTAFSLCSAGTALCAMLLPPIIVAVAEDAGMGAAFFAMGGIAGVITLLFLFFAKNSPEEMGLAPYEQAGEQRTNKRSAAVGFDAGRHAKLLLYLSVAITGGVSLATYAHFNIYFTTSGYSKMTAAACVSMGSALMFAAKILYGRLSDLLGARKVALTCMSLLTVGTVLMCFVPEAAIFMYSGAVLSYVGLPVATVGLPALAGDFSTGETYAKLIGNFQLVSSLGGIAMAQFPGVLYDASGSYRGAFVAAAVLYLVATLLLLVAYRALRREMAAAQ